MTPLIFKERKFEIAGNCSFSFFCVDPRLWRESNWKADEYQNIFSTSSALASLKNVWGGFLFIASFGNIIPPSRGVSVFRPAFPPQAIYISLLPVFTASPYLSLLYPSPPHLPFHCPSLPYLPLRLALAVPSPSPFSRLPSALFRLLRPSRSLLYRPRLTFTPPVPPVYPPI